MTQGTLYNLLTVATDLPERIPPVLTEVFRVPREDIDVSPEWGIGVQELERVDLMPVRVT